MAERAITPATVPQTYAELRRGVEAVVFAGRKRIDEAWLLTFHETGQLISEHLRVNENRADYGAKVFNRLAEDLGISKRSLYECVQFFRYFPIVRKYAQLNRSHFQLLCQVSDAKEREALAEQTVKNEWTVDELRPRVRAINAVALAPSRGDSGDDAVAAAKGDLLVPKRGTPGVYRVAKIDSALVVDLGFASYFDLTDEQAKEVKEGNLVKLSASGQVTAADDATKADLFTYNVELIKVVDGDTLWIKIYLRPRQWMKHKLRLRGLDAPEMSTPEGRAAKRFVEALIAKTTAIVINTTKPDKYDRYLADVFLTTDSGEIFLNNALLENGQAVRKDAWEFGDWEPDLMK
jgi:endonuclease YncB( thermonuclease family)